MKKLTLLVVLAACGHRAPTTSPPPIHEAPADAAAPAPDAGPADARPLADDLTTLAARSVAMIEQIADGLAAGGDCATLASRVTIVMDATRDVRTAAAAVSDRGDGPVLEQALAAYKDRVVAAAARMQPAIDRCGKDAAFAAALTPMDTP